MTFKYLLPVLCLSAAPLLAEAPVIENITATKQASGWQISVTLSHPDTGWEHYADGWRVLDENGKELGRRDLLHPHVKEQPVTRSLSGVMIPDGLGTIHVQSRCLVDGWSETTKAYSLP